MLAINVTFGSRSAGLTLSRYFKNCYYMGPEGRLREYPKDDRPKPTTRSTSRAYRLGFAENYSPEEIDRFTADLERRTNDA